MTTSSATGAASEGAVRFGDRRRPVAGFGDEKSPWDLLRTLWARKELLFISSAVIFILAALWLLTATPTYTVEARLLVEDRRGEISRFDDPSPRPGADEQTIESEIEILTSRPVVERLVEELQLYRLPEFNPAFEEPGFLSRLLGAGNVPADRAPNGEAAVKAAAERVLDRLGVYQKGSSRVIAIYFTAEDPQVAARVANTLAELYITVQNEAADEVHDRATVWLRGEIDRLRDEVEASEAKVEDFRVRSDLLGTNGTTLAQQQLTDLNAQLSTARAQLSDAEARLALARRLLAGGGNAETAAEVLQSALIQNLREREVELQARIAEMSQTLLPTHPRMVDARAQADDLRQAISREIAKVAQALENEAGIARGRVRALERQVEELKQALAAANGEEVTLRALEREAAANRTLLEQFLNRYEQATARRSVEAEAARGRIISRAVPPDEPTFPKKGPALGMAFLAALLGGHIIVLLVEVFASGLRTADDVERATGMPLLGLVPALPRRSLLSGADPAAELLRDPNSAYSEAIRTLQGAIALARIGDRAAQVVMISSSRSGEGKTATATSLARAMALGGARVCLVEADLRQPGVHSAMGLQRTSGLGDFLMGHLPAQSLIGRDPEGSAHIIQAGSPVANPTAALASARMDWLIANLRRSYSYIIIDTPPILAAADARVLAEKADVAVFAVKWADTSKAQAQQGLKHLSASAGTRRVGVLLTRVDMRRYRRYGYSALGGYGIMPEPQAARR